MSWITEKQMDKITEILNQHQPIVTTSECEFGDHEFWSCKCDWSAKDIYGGGSQEWTDHIREAIVCT